MERKAHPLHLTYMRPTLIMDWNSLALISIVLIRGKNEFVSIPWFSSATCCYTRDKDWMLRCSFIIVLKILSVQYVGKIGLKNLCMEFGGIHLFSYKFTAFQIDPFPTAGFHWDWPLYKLCVINSSHQGKWYGTPISAEYCSR